MDSDEAIRRLTDLLRRSSDILAITGAGVSAESGISTFRDPGGWWRRLDPEKLATARAFREDPGGVWAWYAERRRILSEAAPNAGHTSLGRLEGLGKHVVVVTQNVDDLHELGGATNVVHVHGSIWHARCLAEGTVFEFRTVPLPELPPACPHCGGLLRPDIVWFDEDPSDDVVEEVDGLLRRTAFGVALVIGTQATFDYIVDWALRAKAAGAVLVEINPHETRLTPEVDLVVRDAAGTTLSRCVDALDDRAAEAP